MWVLVIGAVISVVIAYVIHTILAAPSDSCGGTLEAFINNEPTGVCVVCVCGLVAVMLVLLQDKCTIVGVTCDRILKRLHTPKLSHKLIVVATRTFNSC